MYVCECECLLWLALSFLHHRNSPVVHLGLTVADWVQVLLDCRCHLKIAFTPTPPPWNTRTDKKRLFSLGIQKPPPHIDLNMCAQPNFSVYLFLFFFALPSVKWSIHGRTHTQKENTTNCICYSFKAIPFKRGKDVENDWSWKPFNSPVFHLPPCHLIFSMQHANQKRPLVLSLSGISSFV